MKPGPTNLLGMSSAVALAGLLALPATAFSDSDSLNVLMYHHVADDTPASTSTRVDTFADHLAYLDENHTVVDLVDALNALRAGEEIADDAVAITFDDAYISVYDTAWPMLEEYDFPFTVFVNTRPVDRGSSITVNWDQIREMDDAGAHMLNHTHDHAYLVRTEAYDDAWFESVQETINTAQTRLTEELGDEPPRILAYPYGEYNQQIQEWLAGEDYIAMGQHSGGIAEFSDWQGLQRFAAGGSSANLETLRTKLQSRPLPIATPLPNPVTTDRRPELQVRTLENDDVRWGEIQCFTATGTRIPTDLSDGKLTARAPDPLSEGRQRYNCTAPSHSGGYFWFSHQWVIR